MMWYSANTSRGNKDGQTVIARLNPFAADPAASIHEFFVTAPSVRGTGIAAGPHATIWSTEFFGTHVDRVDVPLADRQYPPAGD